MTWGAGGPGQRWVLLYNQSTSYMLTIQPDETHLGCLRKKKTTDAHWFETPTPSLKGRRCTVLLWIVFTYNLSNPRKEVAASWSQRSVSSVSCVRLKLTMSVHILYCMCVCIHIHKKHIHTHAVPAQTIIGDRNPQWRCLDYAELSWSSVSPTMVRTFISIPVRLLLPFVRVIYTTVYAHTTCKPAVPPCKENVM